jgi:hypothetical protein
MARSIKEIAEEIKKYFIGNTLFQRLYGIDVTKTWDEQFKETNIETILIYNFATAIASLENIFDYFRRDISRIVENERYGYKGWYEQIAKAYEHGANKDKIVHAAWCGDGQRGIVNLKVSKISGTDFEPLNETELNGLSYYISRMKPAGIFVNIISTLADDLGYAIDIYYNPTILDKDGNLISGNGQPVDDAIKNYLQGLDFNGEFVTMKLVDTIQQIEGVDIVEVKGVWSRYLDYNWENIDARQIPYSGFFTTKSEAAKAKCSINYKTI